MTTPSTTDNKLSMRQQIRSRRQQLSIAEHLKLDTAIRSEILKTLKRLDASRLSAFWSFDGEPDLCSALESLDQDGGAIALPVLDREREAGISLRRWRSGSEMKANRFGILEPVDEPPVAIHELDCMLIPLVAWDQSGGRLGMGSGYYDRLLAPVRHKSLPLRIGVAYGLQEVPSVPMQKNDVGLHGVICEHGWIPAVS